MMNAVSILIAIICELVKDINPFFIRINELPQINVSEIKRIHLIKGEFTTSLTIKLNLKFQQPFPMFHAFLQNKTEVHGRLFFRGKKQR